MLEQVRGQGSDQLLQPGELCRSGIDKAGDDRNEIQKKKREKVVFALAEALK